MGLDKLQRYLTDKYAVLWEIGVGCQGVVEVCCSKE